ncbi:uncharacterized protein LOC103512741 [Diaphorina citri]|uniref:Uncharacterized protein LOC103512741 n=1 Tax=Diaphorina citri TaxID=121845 RepID=A0A3Q0J4S6_DIACI|nr:uncharacterized protein LOC103512741 [Diaphorina citri]
MKVFSILLPSLLINFISCRGIAINNDMFNFYVFISILIQFLFAFKRAKELEFTIPGNYSSSYHHIQNPPKKKSDLFKLGTVKKLTDDEKYKLKYNFASGRFCRKKSYLNKNQIFNCKDNPEFTAYIGNKITCGAAVPTKKLNDTIQNTFLSAQNATVHTLKDLIHKHIMNHINQSNLMLKNGTSSITVNVTEFEVSTTVSHQTFNNVYSNNSHSSPLYQTKHMVHNTALRFIKPTINSVNDNPGAIKGLFKYHDRKRSSIETFPNMTKHQRPRAFTNNQIQFYLRNEHGNRFNVSSGDISTKINIEKNPKNNSVKEIMIIEIPMKSPPDKNVLLDLNDFPLVKPSSDGKLYDSHNNMVTSD